MRLAHSIDSFVAQASMARRRGSLADEISSLLDMRHAEPGDDGDDALDGLGPGSLLAEDDVAPVAGARRLRQTGIDLGAAGAKYAGRVVSQKTRSARQRRVEEVEDEEEEEEEEGCDSDDDDDDDDEEEEEEDDDDDDEDFDPGDADDDDDDEGDLACCKDIVIDSGSGPAPAPAPAGGLPFQLGVMLSPTALQGLTWGQ